MGDKNPAFAQDILDNQKTGIIVDGFEVPVDRRLALIGENYSVITTYDWDEAPVGTHYFVLAWREDAASPWEAVSIPDPATPYGGSCILNVVDDTTFDLTVDNVAPTVDAGVDQTINASDDAEVSASFTDPGADDTHTATIDWGDSSPLDDGVVDENARTVTGSHHYDAPGQTYTVTVCVTDSDGDSGCDSLSVDVRNIVTNGDFSDGETGWNFYGEIDHSVSAGVLTFNRQISASAAVIYQDAAPAFDAGTHFQLDLDLSNSSSEARTINVVVVRKADWSDSAVCQFTLAPNSPLRPQMLQGITATAWSDLRLEISPVEEDSSSVLGMDNVVLAPHPELSNSATNCISPDITLTNALNNGDFSAGMANWATWDGVVSQLTGGVLQPYRTSGSASATVYQSMQQPIAINSHVELQMQLGNTSDVDKRMIAIVRNSDWSNYLVCPFMVPAYSALQNYNLRSDGSTEPWAIRWWS